MALANIAPDECARVQQAFESGDHADAQTLYRQLFPVNIAITATYGVAGLKYAADLCGYRGVFVRKPLLPLQEDAKTDIKSILTSAHLLE